MIIDFTIPAWVLWTIGLGIGVPALIVLCFFAYMGFVLMRAFARWQW